MYFPDETLASFAPDGTRNSDKLSPVKRKANVGTEARIRFTPDRTRNLGRPFDGGR